MPWGRGLARLAEWGSFPCRLGSHSEVRWSLPRREHRLEVSLHGGLQAAAGLAVRRCPKLPSPRGPAQGLRPPLDCRACRGVAQHALPSLQSPHKALFPGSLQFRPEHDPVCWLGAQSLEPGARETRRPREPSTERGNRRSGQQDSTCSSCSLQQLRFAPGAAAESSLRHVWSVPAPGRGKASSMAWLWE